MTVLPCKYCDESHKKGHATQTFLSHSSQRKGEVHNKFTLRVIESHKCSIQIQILPLTEL